MAGLRFRMLEIFVECADAGSLGDGAERLELSLSAVSMGISRLEKHLGVKLYGPNRRHLSAEGEALLLMVRDDVRRMRNVLDRIETD